MSFNLPTIDTMKDLLTGSLSSRFQALIEPYALVNAGVFLTLNLTLVYSQMSGPQAGSQLLAAIAALSAAWQVVLTTFLLFLLSYLINNLSRFFLDLTSTEVFRDSPWIGTYLKNIHIKRFQNLTSAMNGLEDKNAKLQEMSESAYFLAYHYPVEENEIGLSKLGNLLISPASYVSHQYGASMDLIWPIIHEKVGDDDKTVGILQGNWTSLQFFSSLQVLLVIVSLELLSIFVFLGGHMPWLPILALLLGAGICYYLSLDKALQWGRSVRRVFDSHMKDVFPELGMNGLKDITPSAEKLKNYMKDISNWLAYGAMGKGGNANEEWYKIPTVPPPETWPKLKYPAFLSVESVKSITGPLLQTEPSGYLYFEKQVDYMFAISNTNSGEYSVTGENAYLLVQDKGIVSPATVKGTLSETQQQGNSIRFKVLHVLGVLQAKEPPSLLFPLDNIAPGHSRILRFSCQTPASARVKLDKTKLSMEVLPNKGVGFHFELRPQINNENQKTSVTVEVLDPVYQVAAEALIQGTAFRQETGKLKDPSYQKWEFALKAGEVARVWMQKK
jgi:hypothetical protein